jgi:hypothetical protein
VPLEHVQRALPYRRGFLRLRYAAQELGRVTDRVGPQRTLRYGSQLAGTG